MKTNLYCIALAGMVAACAFAQSSNSPAFGGQTPARYQVTDLGTFGGGFSIAYGINNTQGKQAGPLAYPTGPCTPSSPVR